MKNVKTTNFFLQKHQEFLDDLIKYIFVEPCVNVN